MYGNVFEDEERVQRQAVFPRLLCQNAPDFSFVSDTDRHTQTPDKWARDQNYTSFGLRVSLKWEHEIVISQQILARRCSPRHLIANCCNLSGSQLRTYVACNGYLSVFTACLWGKMLILNKSTCLVLGERKTQTTHLLIKSVLCAQQSRAKIWKYPLYFCLRGGFTGRGNPQELQ